LLEGRRKRKGERGRKTNERWWLAFRFCRRKKEKEMKQRQKKKNESAKKNQDSLFPLRHLLKALLKSTFCFRFFARGRTSFSNLSLRWSFAEGHELMFLSRRDRGGREKVSRRSRSPPSVDVRGTGKSFRAILFLSLLRPLQALFTRLSIFSSGQTKAIDVLIPLEFEESGNAANWSRKQFLGIRGQRRRPFIAIEKAEAKKRN